MMSSSSNMVMAIVLLASMTSTLQSAMAKSQVKHGLQPSDVHTVLGTCVNPAESAAVYAKDRVAYGDMIKIQLTAYAQDEIRPDFIHSPKVTHEFVVGKHNVPAVNDGVVGMCVGEVRKMLARIGKNGGSLAYMVELQEITGKSFLKHGEVVTAPGAWDNVSGLKAGGESVLTPYHDEL